MVIITPFRDMASCSCVIAANVPDLSSSSHHPSETFSFPKRSFGKTKVVWRSFQPAPTIVSDKTHCCMYIFWVLWKNYVAWPLKYSLLRACCISVLSSFFINPLPDVVIAMICFFFTRSCCYRLLLTTLRRVAELSDLVHTLLLMSWFYGWPEQLHLVTDCPWMPLN